MPEHFAQWIGLHALECFLGVLAGIIVLILVVWHGIVAGWGTLERLAGSLARLPGLEAGGPPRRSLFLMLIAVGGLASLHLLIDLAGKLLQEKSLILFDETLAATIMRNSDPAVVEAFGIITMLGDPVSLAIIGLGVGLGLCFLRRWILLAGWIGAIAGGTLIAGELKAIFQRPRPEALSPHVPQVSGWAFPSGHAMNSLVLYGMLAYVIVARLHAPARKSAVLIASCFILAIGFSRVYLGVHYLSDVLAGYAAGMLWLALCVTTLEVIRLSSVSRHPWKDT